MLLFACGGAGPGPITPSPTAPALPHITVRVSPTPLDAAFLGTTGAGSSYRLAAEVTLTETAGTGGRIDQITTTITTLRRVQGFITSVSSFVTRSSSLQFSPSGTVTYTHSGDFAVSGDVESVTWRFAVSGVDSQGRAFTAASESIPVNLGIP